MNLITRTIIFIFFTAFLYFLPWWFLFTAIFVVMFLKRVLLFELVVPAFMIDVIYGVPLERFYDFQFVATCIMVLMLVTIFFIKKYLRN